MEETMSLLETIDVITKFIAITLMIIQILYAHIGKTKTLEKEMKVINSIIIMCGVSVITSLFTLSFISMFLWVLYGVMWYASGRFRENYYDNIERRKNGDYSNSIDYGDIMSDIKNSLKNIKW